MNQHDFDDYGGSEENAMHHHQQRDNDGDIVFGRKKRRSSILKIQQQQPRQQQVTTTEFVETTTMTKRVSFARDAYIQEFDRDTNSKSSTNLDKYTESDTRISEKSMSLVESTHATRIYDEDDMEEETNVDYRRHPPTYSSTPIHPNVNHRPALNVYGLEDEDELEEEDMMLDSSLTTTKQYQPMVTTNHHSEMMDIADCTSYAPPNVTPAYLSSTRSFLNVLQRQPPPLLDDTVDNVSHHVSSTQSIAPHQQRDVVSQQHRLSELEQRNDDDRHACSITLQTPKINTITVPKISSIQQRRLHSPASDVVSPMIVAKKKSRLQSPLTMKAGVIDSNEMSIDQQSFDYEKSIVCNDATTTITSVRRKLRRSIDQGSAPSPTTMAIIRQQQPLSSHNNNWTMNATDVSNIDDERMRVNDTTILAPTPQQTGRRTYAPATMRSFLDTSIYRSAIVEPSIIPDVKLDEESEMIEEMTNPTLTSIDFSPTLKTIGICEYRANEHELVLVQMKRKIRAKIIADLKNHNMKLKSSIDQRLLRLHDRSLIGSIVNLDPSKLTRDQQRMFELCRLKAQANWFKMRKQFVDSSIGSIEKMIDERQSLCQNFVENRRLIDQLEILENDANCVYAKLQTMRTIVDKDVDIIIENERAKRRNDAEIERLIGELRNMQRDKLNAEIDRLTVDNDALQIELAYLERKRDDNSTIAISFAKKCSV